MILSGNSLEHLLVSLGAYAAGVPVMPISVAYSLMSADHARIRAIAELTDPGWCSPTTPGRSAPPSTRSRPPCHARSSPRGEREGALRLDDLLTTRGRQCHERR